MSEKRRFDWSTFAFVLCGANIITIATEVSFEQKIDHAIPHATLAVLALLALRVMERAR